MAKRARVLVVDDEPDIITILTEILELFGFESKSASGGREALQMLREESFDLVISDIKMPNGSGIELLTEAKKLNPVKPIFLFISAYSDNSLAEMMDLGAEALFPKPFDASAIESTVRSALVPPQMRWSHPTSDESQLQIVKSVPSVTKTAEDVQLGRGGLFIHIEDDFPLESQAVAFDIDIEDKHPVAKISGEGRVIWTRKEKGSDGLSTGIGVEFVHLSKESLNAVADFIEETKEVAYIPIGR